MHSNQSPHLANVSSAAQLRHEGIGKAIRSEYGGRVLGALADAPRKRARSDDGADGSMSPTTDLEASRHHLEDLRSEVLELKMQAERAKRVRLEKERMTNEIARQTQQQWAELELAKKDLVRELADEEAKAAAQEVGYLILVASITCPLIQAFIGRARKPAARLRQCPPCTSNVRVGAQPSNPMLSAPTHLDPVKNTSFPNPNFDTSIHHITLLGNMACGC